MHAEREVGGVEQGAAPPLDQGRDPRRAGPLHPVVPGDDGDAGVDQPLEVRHRRVGPGELDRDVGASRAARP